MFFSLKKLFFTFTINSCFFFLLIVGIQNSSIKKKVNFIATETVKLPISFVIGVSFITGSITGSFLSLDLINKKS